MNTFTATEKNRIFLERTQELWPGNWTNYLELVKHELWSKDELQEYNFKRRLEILKYAYENTAFYKKLYDEAGLNPQDIRTEEDWTKVPIVTKQMVAENSSDFEVKADIERYGFAAHTGGSTGKPLRVFRDKRHFWQAPFWRFYGWHLGRQCGTPLPTEPIWGMDQSYIGRFQYLFGAESIRRRQIAFWPIHHSFLDAYSDFDSVAPKYLEEISKSPLVRIYAYAGAIDMLADYCLKNEIKQPTNIAFAELCASPVTNVTREKIKQALGCKVFDFYGSNEMGPMAVECAYCGEDHHLHVLSDLLNIELVDDNGKVVSLGEEGTTIVTCFDNKVFPFVRYNHGDRTHFTSKPCDCGLPFPCIVPVRGRKTEYLVTANGLKIDGVGFTEIFDYHPKAAGAFQFRQTKEGCVTFVVVQNNNYDKSMEEINFVYQKLQDDFRGQIKFVLKCVDSIKYDGGKIRYIVHE